MYIYPAGDEKRREGFADSICALGDIAYTKNIRAPGVMCGRDAYADTNCCTTSRKSNFHPTAMLNMSTIWATFLSTIRDFVLAPFTSRINAKGVQILWGVVEINYTSAGQNSLIKLPTVNVYTREKELSNCTQWVFRPFAFLQNLNCFQRMLLLQFLGWNRCTCINRERERGGQGERIISFWL